MEKIDIDHPTLTHMLGYLTAKQWADALRTKSVDPDTAYKLIKIQDEKYYHCNNRLHDEVEEELNPT